MEIPGYCIEKVLGSGGMATVHLCTQESFGRKVAVKVLSRQLAADEEFASRFLREAKIVAQLSHPHIIPVYDVGQFNNIFYMSMDYLSGGDLSRWIKAGLVEQEAVQITSQIAQALQYAHSKGYIHRDIKPDNIMFREDNSAVLTDFGIACLQDANDRITREGSVIGTPKYMSPEQLQGEDVDGRTDIYALGIVFFEMLMKHPPYESSNFAALSLKHIKDPIPTLPPQFSHYQTFLEKIIAKDPLQRFQHGLEVVKALVAIQENKQTTTAQQSPEPHKANLAETVSELNTDTAEVQTQRTTSKNVRQKKLKVSEHPSNTKAQPVETDSENSKNIKKGFSFEEKTIRKAGLLKRYVLVCTIVTDETHHFSVLFSQVTTRILDWHEKYQKKCTAIEFNIAGGSWIYRRAEEAIRHLYEEGGSFSFINDLEVTVNLRELNGNLVDSIKICA